MCTAHVTSQLVLKWHAGALHPASSLLFPARLTSPRYHLHVIKDQSGAPVDIDTRETVEDGVGRLLKNHVEAKDKVYFVPEQCSGVSARSEHRTFREHVPHMF